MSESPTIHPNYPPPLDQLLTLGQPKGHDSALDYRKLGLAEEHIPELLRMVADEQLHTALNDTDLIWAPVHAWRALEELKAEAAIGPLLGLLASIDDDEDDWVDEEVPRVLGKLGGAALEPVTSYLANPAHGEWARVAAAKALAEIGAEHTDLRAECVSRLTRITHTLLNKDLVVASNDLIPLNFMPTRTSASRTTVCPTEPLLFADLGRRQVLADFSGGYLSSPDNSHTFE